MPRLSEVAEKKGIKIAEKANPDWFIFVAYTHVCEGCGCEFVSARPHTKTCSSTCRKRVSRYNKTIAK